MREQWQDCYADWSNGEVLIGNRKIERRWRFLVRDGAPRFLPVSLLDKTTGREWLLPQDEALLAGDAGSVMPLWTVGHEPVVPGSGEGLVATFAVNAPTGEETWIFRIVPEEALVLTQVCRAGGLTAAAGSAKKASDAPTGVEDDAAAGKVVTSPLQADLCEGWRINTDHLFLHQIELQDQTDHNDNLMHWRRHYIGTLQTLRLQGCVFALEDPLTRQGVILLKHAPLPYARAAACPCDLHAANGMVNLLGQGTGDGGEGYPWAVLFYEGGRDGITRALQHERHLLHPYRPGRDGLAISNTWGDRNRDAALCNDFLCAELQTARELGADACQIDDGWQRGTTSNSVNAAKGGVWEGFYAADPDFWQFNPHRLPQGLEPIIRKAADCGVGVGLWFAPDSAHDFANWRKDADTILRFHREHGVKLIKIDGVKSRTKIGERNLRQFFAAVLEESRGEVLFDQDVTAEVRPGYLGRPETGPLFVENRYTDWHRYWPSTTLRNLWHLAHVLPPVALRMEWLNPERNAEKYAGDPIAPGACPVEFVFAGIMVSSPLLWCELSNLSASVKERLGAMLRLWKTWRQELHTGIVYPIGQEPDGAAWTGWLVDGGQYLHLIALREDAPEGSFRYDLPSSVADLAAVRVTQLAGGGAVKDSDRMLEVTLPGNKSFGWWRLERALPR